MNSVLKAINRYKSIKKQKYLKSLSAGTYAMIGFGHHSIQNILPVLQHFNTHIKYAVSLSKQTSDLISRNGNIHFEGTTDLNTVLNDKEIKGVFISVSAHDHFGLVKKALLHDKHVWVEKPVCLELEELQELIEIQQSKKKMVMVGMQKRYAPANILLKSHLRNTIFYHYEFLLGSYPEGDPLTDLFIHPLDLISYFFGPSKIVSLKQQKQKSLATTLMLHVEHKNGVMGNLVLSSDHAWGKSAERMYVNTEQRIYECFNSKRLHSFKKSGSILGVPTEKIINNKNQIDVLFDESEFLPQLQSNQLYTSGYYNEIKTFLGLCDGQVKKSTNLSNLQHLVPAYELIEFIRNRHKVSEFDLSIRNLAGM